MSRELASNDRFLYGTEAPALVQCLGAPVQPALAAPLAAMAAAASEAGFDLAVASGHRNFERQLHIFNAKASGARPVLDLQGQVLDILSMTESARLHAILRWSALPGMSRHHWGTDIDIYDKRICVGEYRLQLTLAECEGPMAAFYSWLEGYLAAQSAFVRPYAEDRGGVAPEPWHLSYAPLSVAYARLHSAVELQRLLAGSDIALKAQVLAQLPELFARYGV